MNLKNSKVIYKLRRANKNDVKKLYSDYFTRLQDGINFYVEKRILASQSFLIIDDVVLGIFSVDTEGCLTGFYIINNYIEKYSDALDYVLEEKHIEKIYLTTKDHLFLNEIEKRKYSKEIHSFNFIYTDSCNTDFQMELIPKEEVNTLLPIFGEFLEYNSVNLMKTDLYIYKNDHTYVCLGFYEKYKLINRASVAMIVNPQYRKQGYGTKTLQFLACLLQAKNIPIYSRCWVGNITSKKTLLKAGYQISSETIYVYINKK